MPRRVNPFFAARQKSGTPDPFSKTNSEQACSSLDCSDADIHVSGHIKGTVARDFLLFFLSKILHSGSEISP